MQLTWNRGSPVITQATSAVLSIEDGDAHRTIPLQAAQVRTGSILYTPVSDQVQMQLAVITPSASVTESVLVLLPKTGPARTVAIHPPVAAEPPQRAANKNAPRSVFARPFTPTPSPARQVTPVTSFAEPPALSTGATSAAATAPWSRPAFNLPPPAPSADSAQPEPQRPGAPAAVYSPPEPLQQVRPAFPAALKFALSRATTIEVIVTIDDAGRVVKVTPRPQPGLNPMLLENAVATAKQWRFKPAHRGDTPVASEMLLRFNFIPSR